MAAKNRNIPHSFVKRTTYLDELHQMFYPDINVGSKEIDISAEIF